MRPVKPHDLTRLLGEQRPPCVSVFVSTPKTYPACKQGPIEYRNLVGLAQESLERKYSAANIQSLLKPFRALVDNEEFWEHRQAGLAVLGSASTFDTFDLRRPPLEKALVAESFDIMPLLRSLQSADRFHVLCLHRDSAQLYEGNRDGLQPIKPAGVPLTVTDALGDEVVVQRKEQTFAGKSPGEPRPAPRGPNAPPGHPAARDDAKLDAERFFRVIDRAVWEHVSRDSGHPLVLVALPEQQAMFRAVSRNPQLLDAGVARGPAEFSEACLLEEVWRCVEPGYLERLGTLIENFHVARPRAMASDDLSAIARAAYTGRVGFGLVEADRAIPGQLDPRTGDLRFGSDKAAAGDILNDLVGLILRKKGDVVVVPAERMPTTTGLAAVYRY